MSGDILTIACTVNRLYVQPLMVALASLVDHLPAGTPVHVFLLHHDLTPEDLGQVERFARVSSVAPPVERLVGLPLRPPFTREAYYPLLLPDVLPAALDRVLFLDADLLVLDDLMPLWQTDLAGAPVGAVQDGAIPLVSSPRGLSGHQAIGIPASAPYFNAGVMLMDLDVWRRQDVSSRAFDYLRTAGRVDFLHQEALNAVVWNEWRPLPARWNVLAGLAGRFVDAPTRPAIAHFAGRFKPWRTPVGGPFGPAYGRVLERVRQPQPPFDATGLATRLTGAYDRHLRKSLYPLERFLWNRRLL